MIVEQNTDKPAWAQFASRKMIPALRVQADRAKQLSKQLRQLADELDDGGSGLTNDRVGECEFLTEVSSELHAAISAIAAKLDHLLVPVHEARRRS
jgi:hypothetical protein